MFFNMKDNVRLDKMGFAPVARCVEGCSTLHTINLEYGQQPQQDVIKMRGNAYLKEKFPRLDYITSATIVERPLVVPALDDNTFANINGGVQEWLLSGVCARHITRA